ncbi:MAG: alpha/beta hydrolase [Actinomycetota bacterium]
MATTTNDGTELYFETFGSADDPTVLLVNGLGSQMINWEPDFCRRFVDRGYQVVVYDNRDVGLSGKTPGTPPNVLALMDNFRSGTPATGTPYTLTDMAEDGLAVLDAVGAERAHIAGMSMGGMIVQRMALHRPDRVASMTSIMSTTGAPGVGAATSEAAATLVTPAPEDREGYIAHTMESRRIIDGSHHSPDYWRQHAGRTYDRMFHPIGPAFQIAAIAADGNRTEELASMTVPSLVIHGRMDPLITLSGGEATAAAIPDAELLVIDEMGHDLPPEIWDEVVAAMIGLFDRAGG